MGWLKYLNPGDNAGNIKYYDSDVTDGKKRLRRVKEIKAEDEYFLTLTRLRRGLLETDLAVRFGVSKSTVHRICISWINFTYLRFGSLCVWPSKEAIKNIMAESMKEKYPNAEWLIDAFEIQCERPSFLQLQSQSYSNYKSRNTVKGLIACTPSGQDSFHSYILEALLTDSSQNEMVS